MTSAPKFFLPYGKDILQPEPAQVGITKCHKLWIRHDDTPHVADIDVERLRQSSNPDLVASDVLVEALKQVGLMHHDALVIWCAGTGTDVLNTIARTADPFTRDWVWRHGHGRRTHV